MDNEITTVAGRWFEARKSCLGFKVLLCVGDPYSEEKTDYTIVAAFDDREDADRLATALHATLRLGAHS